MRPSSSPLDTPFRMALVGGGGGGGEGGGGGGEGGRGEVVELATPKDMRGKEGLRFWVKRGI